MSDTNITELGFHSNMTAVEVLEVLLRKARCGEIINILCVGEYADTDLMSVSSKMTRAEANWLLDSAKRYVLRS